MSGRKPPATPATLDRRVRASGVLRGVTITLCGPIAWLAATNRGGTVALLMLAIGGLLVLVSVAEALTARARGSWSNIAGETRIAGVPAATRLTVAGIVVGLAVAIWGLLNRPLVVFIALTATALLGNSVWAGRGRQQLRGLLRGEVPVLRMSPTTLTFDRPGTLPRSITWREFLGADFVRFNQLEVRDSRHGGQVIDLHGLPVSHALLINVLTFYAEHASERAELGTAKALARIEGWRAEA